MRETLIEVGKAFALPGTFSDYEILKTGNINQTCKVTYRLPDGAVKPYIFQKVNTNVFRNPAEIMENIDRVTSHIRKKCDGRPTLYFYRASGTTPYSGKNYTYDQNGSFWRVTDFIDSVTVPADDPAVLRATGEAFGEFQLQLADFDGSVLHETIPDFHNTRKRIDDLFADAREDRASRLTEVSAELETIRSFSDRACVLCDQYNNHAFPVRVTHNDTKANNVLLDPETLRPLAVIDLDTVMPGMAMYDFGDAVRFLANTAAEDEPDLTKVSFDIARFTAFAEGFLGQVKDSLTPEEIDSMADGAFCITVELAARFLDDYLNGDVYFKTDYPDHNLVRARCQLHLAKDILRKSDELQEIVRRITH